MPAHNMIAHSDPTVVNEATATATVGDVYFYMHATHGPWHLLYTQFKDAVTYAAGQALTLAHVAKTSVTNDVSGGSSIGAVAGGVALGVMTQNYYGYALVRGYYPTVKTNGDDDIAAGDCIKAGGADGTVDSGTTAVGGEIGYATTADVDADNTVAAYITVY